VLFVGNRVSANGRGRWMAIAASLVVSATLIYVQSTESPRSGQTPAAAPVGGQDFQFALPAGVAPEGGWQVKTVWVARAISVMFPEVTTIGGGASTLVSAFISPPAAAIRPDAKPATWAPCSRIEMRRPNV
jgi:hypothetical protein